MMPRHHRQRACWQGRRRGQATGQGPRDITCLTLAQVEGAARFHGCRVVETSGNGGDGCVGLLLRSLPFGPSLSCSLLSAHTSPLRANSIWLKRTSHHDVHQSAWRQLVFAHAGSFSTHTRMLHIHTAYLPARRSPAPGCGTAVSLYFERIHSGLKEAGLARGRESKESLAGAQC